MDEFERNLSKVQAGQLDDVLTKDRCKLIVEMLLERLEEKYGTIVQKPIFVERTIEVLIPKYREVNEHPGLLRKWFRKVW